MKKINDTEIEKSPYYITDKNGKVKGEVFYNDKKKIWTLFKGSPYAGRGEDYINFDDAVIAGKRFDFKVFLDTYFGVIIFVLLGIFFSVMIYTMIVHGPCK